MRTRPGTHPAWLLTLVFAACTAQPQPTDTTTPEEPTPSETETPQNEVTYTVETVAPPTNAAGGAVFDTGVRASSAEQLSVTYAFTDRGGTPVTAHAVAFAHQGKVYAIAPWVDGGSVTATFAVDGKTLSTMEFTAEAVQPRTGTPGAALSSELVRTNTMLQALDPARPSVTTARQVVADAKTALDGANSTNGYTYGSLRVPNGEAITLAVTPEGLALAESFLLNAQGSMPPGVEAHLACRSSAADAAICVAMGVALVTGSIPLAAMGTMVAIGSVVATAMQAEGGANAYGQTGPVQNAYNSIVSRLTSFGAVFHRDPLDPSSGSFIKAATRALCGWLSCPSLTACTAGNSCCDGKCQTDSSGTMAQCDVYTDMCRQCLGDSSISCVEQECCSGRLKWLKTCIGCTPGCAVCDGDSP